MFKRGSSPPPELDLSGVVLMEDDLPSGFQRHGGMEAHIAAAMRRAKPPAESVFCFIEPEKFQVVAGGTGLLGDPMERATFDLMARKPDTALGVAAGVLAGDVLERAELPDCRDFGDVSGGWSIVTDIYGTRMRYDQATARRGLVGVWVLVAYLDGEPPVVAACDALRMLDERAVCLIGPTSRASTPKTAGEEDQAGH